MGVEEAEYVVDKTIQGASIMFNVNEMQDG